MNTVKTLLKSKPASTPCSITPDTTVLEALRLMAERNVGALLVMKDDQLLGMLSERDYARRVAQAADTSVHLPVSEIMTSPVWTVTLQSTRETCMSIMTNKRVRHLPVLDNGRVVNVLSIGDLVKDALNEQEETIHQLEQYVNS